MCVWINKVLDNLFDFYCEHIKVQNGSQKFWYTDLDWSRYGFSKKIHRFQRNNLLFYHSQVGDRLFSAFGQDTIDALFWTATEPKGRKREHIGVLPHFLLTIGYVILHTLLVLLQATTLNVAINASNKALLTIMMSNNVSKTYWFLSKDVKWNVKIY